MNEIDKKISKLKEILIKYFYELGPDYEIKIDKILENIDNNKLQSIKIDDILKYELNKETDLNKLKQYINIMYSFNYPKRISNLINNNEQEITQDLEELDYRFQKSEQLEKEELEKKLSELEKQEELERKERTEKFELQIEKEKEEELRKKEEDKNKIELVEIHKKNRKKILVDASISEIESNLKDNEFLKQQYDIINENKTHIENLQKTIEEINDTNKKDAYAYEIEQLEKLNDKAIDSSIKYIIETNKIQMAIKNLEEPADVLKSEKEYTEKRRDFFNTISSCLFITSALFFIFFILIFYSILNGMEVALTIYFLATFPIIFTGLLGLVMVRQSNLKSKELLEINKRFILIHEIKQSLRALVEIYRGKDNMNDKTEKIIDKLIINILNYSSNSIDSSKENEENEKNELIELNTKLDTLIDTVNKKLTLINNINKINGTT